MTKNRETFNGYVCAKCGYSAIVILGHPKFCDGCGAELPRRGPPPGVDYFEWKHNLQSSEGKERQ